MYVLLCKSPYNPSIKYSQRCTFSTFIYNTGLFKMLFISFHKILYINILKLQHLFIIFCLSRTRSGRSPLSAETLTLPSPQRGLPRQRVNPTSSCSSYFPFLAPISSPYTGSIVRTLSRVKKPWTAE